MMVLLVIPVLVLVATPEKVVDLLKRRMYSKKWRMGDLDFLTFSHLLKCGSSCF